MVQKLKQYSVWPGDVQLMAVTPKDKLVRDLRGRSILVWGARMTGMGFLRFAKKNDLVVVGFVDSDPSVQGRVVNGCRVYSPEMIPSMKSKNDDMLVVVAVALKEDEIIESLNGYGLFEGDYVNYSAYVDNFYTIDVVGSCNLRCPSCAHGMDYNSPKGMMPFKDFKQVTHKMMGEVDIVSHVSLYSWGEPFLHPKLDLFIDYLHDFGVAVAVSTNLSIKSSKQIEKVAKSSPDYLKISLSGFYPEAYNLTHVGGNVDIVKSNLYKLKDSIEKYDSSVFVDVNYHLYKNNNGKNLFKMREICDELGFNLSTVYALVMPVERVIGHCDGKPDPKTEALSKLLLVDMDEGREATKSFRDQPCRYLTNQVNINWDKSVPLCCACFDRPHSIILDDYLQSTLEEIIEKKRNHPLCDKCIKYGLPAYNLWFNYGEWDRIASQKESEDI